MAIISPLLALEEERRKRDEAMRQAMANVSTSLVQTPLTYQKLVQDQEDRRNKLAADRQRMEIEKGSFDNDTARLGNDTRSTDATIKNLESDNRRSDTKLNDEHIQKAIADSVAGGIGRGLDDEGILDEARNLDEVSDLTDQSPIEGEISRQRYGRQKDADLLAIKRQDADTRGKRALARSRAGGGGKKGLPVGLSPTQMKYLTTLRQMENQIDAIAQKKQSVNTGVLSTFADEVRRVLKMPTAERAVFGQQLQQMFNAIVKEQAGATVTSNELERQLAAFPDKWTEDEIFDAALADFKQSLEDNENIFLSTLELDPKYGAAGAAQRDYSANPAANRVKAKTAPPKEPGEKRSAYAQRLIAAGFKEEEVMKIVLEAK